MNENRRRLFLIILAVILALLAWAAESLYFTDYEYHYRTKRFQKILLGKEKIMDDCMNGLKPILARGEPHGSVSEKNIFLVAEQNEITILEYIDGKLTYWSDNGFDVPQIRNDSLFTKPLIFLQNGWFIPKTVQAGNEMIVGLLRVRTDYGFENDIIKNGFEKDFRVPANFGFTTEKDVS